MRIIYSHQNLRVVLISFSYYLFKSLNLKKIIKKFTKFIFFSEGFLLYFTDEIYIFLTTIKLSYNIKKTKYEIIFTIMNKC